MTGTMPQVEVMREVKGEEEDGDERVLKLGSRRGPSY